MEKSLTELIIDSLKKEHNVSDLNLINNIETLIKQIALDGWYYCMIGTGGIPLSEELYFKAKERFFKKYNIINEENIKITADSELEDIKMDYLSYYVNTIKENHD